MRIYSCIILLLLLTACSSAPKKRMDKLSILQGITSAKEVEFSVLGPIEKEFNFELTPLKDGLTKMWEWAQQQPMKDRFIWSSYELDKGIYSYWK